ncbi:MAG: hypothetical protein IPN59_09400 [Holophaga sp.]|nr:hypothetical protein [Holophaga sp.]
MRPLLGSLLFLAASALAPLQAQAGLLVPTSTGRPDARVLSLREMNIDIGIARGYARVNVRQVFENHTSTIQEGTYRFALPASAAVGDFAIWDGLQRIPGVILEKKRARSIYQDLARQRIDPGLLQQGEEEDGDPGDGRSSRPSGGALFSVTVAPIPAHATKRLELQFQEEVPFIGGVGEFRLVLRPPDGEAPVAARLTVNISLTDGAFEPVVKGLALTATNGGAAFTGDNVRLDRDLVLRIRPKGSEALRLTAFRNPEGLLPEGFALAPWERPSEIPPEKDGFFLLEASPSVGAKAKDGAKAEPTEAKRPSLSLAILFDTSLSHRWAGLETAYGHLVRVLHSLNGADRFALIPYDRIPAEGVRLRPATAQDIEAELTALRARALGPGANLGAALGLARKLVGEQGRILLLTSGQGIPGSKSLRSTLGTTPLFAAVTVGQAGESLRSTALQVLSNTATEIEGDLFFKRLLAPVEREVAAKTTDTSLPFTVSGGDPKLRHIYPVLVQPLEPGSLSAWVGRYAMPQAKVRLELASQLFPGGKVGLDGAFPEKALEARDLPRRWARARVDDLLARIEAEGERREWVTEIIELSKRYKFITPLHGLSRRTAITAAPRRIQPGDPVLRVECDEGTVSATALFPFGLKLDLVRRPYSNVWEGRFLVPEGLKDGRCSVRILLRDRSGAHQSETKYYVLDGKAPEIQPQLPNAVQAGEVLRIEARTDEDVVLFTARLGDSPPIPLRWDATAKRSVGLLRVPTGTGGTQEVFFEAVDAAKNRGFARATVEVKP